MEFNHQTQKYEPTMADFDKCIKENQALKDRWEKLKDWVKEFHADVVAIYPKTLLDKMQELEKGGN